jgi:hypothetical protein
MSEYQYYEFRAIDRALTEPEMRELRTLSTRAQITPVSFVNFYNYGDFRGDPDKLMEKYFDAFLYTANWGTHRFMLRLPRALVDVQAAAQYCSGDHASHQVKGDGIILEFFSDDENGAALEDDDEDQGTLASLIPVRAGLLAGDLRALYLGWLLSVRMGDFEDEVEEEPPVPAGLGELSTALTSFVGFLRIDRDLIAVAAEQSPARRDIEPSREEWVAWIRGLPAGEQEALLLRVAEGESPHLRGEMLRQYRRDAGPSAGPQGQAVAAVERRSAADLLAAAERHATERKRQEAERRATEKARRDREQAAARAKYLEGLQGREAEIWSRVEALIDTKRPTDYDQAVIFLVDLRDLAARSQREAEFDSRVRSLRGRHALKVSFLRRLDAAAVGAGWPPK